ncbi:MAG: peptidyl-prolyl cis-trans isomerase, partial [Campylobacter sp.]
EGYVTSERKKAIAEFNDRLRSNANIRIIERP